MLTATVQDTYELRWWLLGFGDQVEGWSPSNSEAIWQILPPIWPAHTQSEIIPSSPVAAPEHVQIQPCCW